MDVKEDAQLAEAKAVLASVSEGERRAAEEAFEAWSRQFPMVAKLRSFYAGRSPDGKEVTVPCGRSFIEARFLRISKRLGVSPNEALEIFRGQLGALNEPDDKLASKIELLLTKAGSQQEALDLLRTAPKFLGTMSVREWESRTVEDIRARAAVDNAFDTLNFPIRFFFDRTRDVTAMFMDTGAASDAAPSEEELKAMVDQRKTTYNILSAIFWPIFVGGVLWLSYMDANYGGPIHGKGICGASMIPTYNLADSSGNARLPCTCAPLYKWYVEPLLTEGQKAAFEPPKVESQNCGRTMGGIKNACDPKTVGGCVWTAEDLARSPEYWDPPQRRLTFWEKQRCSDSSRSCGLLAERVQS
jgi:hypothetical protein